jgi:choloylglycine hydrolase
MRVTLLTPLVAVALVAGCNATPSASSEPATGASPLVLAPSGEQAAQTLSSLRQLDDHPLFAMTYVGPSPKLATASAKPAQGAVTVREQRPAGRTAYACTVFLAAGNTGRPLLGRNFDWDHNPALLLHSKPTDGGYASVSLVDLSYLGFTKTDVMDPAKRNQLLRAPALPFDGMNEHGLAIGMAADEVARAEVKPGRPAVGSVGVMRLALDTTRTVDEAVALFGRYNLDFNGGPPLHYLIADATGAGALVEFVAGSMRVTRKQGPWQLMTNFQYAVTDAAGRQADWRYRTASARLDAAGGKLDEAQSLRLLQDVRQGHTQWSLVYDLRSGATAIATGQRYERIHRAVPLRNVVAGT